MDAEAVEQAGRDFEALRALASSEIIDTLVNTEAIRSIDGVGNDIRDARRAVRFTGAYNRDGDPIYERDFPTTLEAIKTARELVESVRPKNGGGVAVNVGIQNNPGGCGGGGGQLRSFEAVLRLVEQRKRLELAGDGHALPSGQDEDVEEAEYEDVATDDGTEKSPDVELDDPDVADED